MIHRGTKLFLSSIVLISALMMLFNFAPSSELLGRAFYISEEGMNVRNPAEEQFPSAMTNINFVFWSLVLVLILAYIVAMHFLGLKDVIPNHLKHQGKKSKK